MQASVLCREQSHNSRSIQHRVQCPFLALQTSPFHASWGWAEDPPHNQPHRASCFQLAHNLGMARTIRSSCLFLAHLMKQMRGEQRPHGKAGNQGITATQQVAGIRENLMHPGAWAHPSHLKRSLWSSYSNLIFFLEISKWRLVQSSSNNQVVSRPLHCSSAGQTVPRNEKRCWLLQRPSGAI